jgi:ADP-ribose pyrophosphatase YjhB (NUDIX family)
VTTFPATYCPACGTELDSRAVDGRERRWCPACERVIWHNPVPTTGVAVVGERGVLVARRVIDPGRGDWYVPGGHLEAEEPPAVAAARELAEETGVRVDAEALTLLDTFFADVGDGKHVVSIGYVVREAATTGDAEAGDEVFEVAWVRPGAIEDEAVYLHSHAERLERAWNWFERRKFGD